MMRVLLVAAEATPLAKSGGLGDVVAALIPALRRRGIDARLLLPRYGWIDRSRFEEVGSLCVNVGARERWCGLLRGDLPGAHGCEGQRPLYLLEHDDFFDRPKLYGDEHGDYADCHHAYALLARAALALPAVTGFRPDVVHAHDWHAALAPVYTRIGAEPDLAGVASVLTIHNLAHQGWFPHADVHQMALGGQHLGELGLEAAGGTPNILHGGIINATLVTTVSPSYAMEIQTPTFGEGLDGALRWRRRDLFGVLNGVDVDVWNPQTDPHIAAHFSADDLAGKAECKAALQREAGLPEHPDVPLVGMVTRLTTQKGIDLAIEAFDRTAHEDMQFVLLGTGSRDAEDYFRGAAARRSDRFAAFITFDERLAHIIEAGADLFLMPSRFEPCGLNQLYSQRYGTLPIVRATGGLRDTVRNLGDDAQGDGFVFHDASPEALAATLSWACAVYRDERERFRAAQRRAMALDRGWDKPAAKYAYIYRLAKVRAEAAAA